MRAITDRKNHAKNNRAMSKKIIFIGLSGFGYPHTRVRCYNFQRELQRLGGIRSEVLSFRDHLCPQFSEGDMYRLRDRDKLQLTLKGLRRLFPEKGNLFYVQKAHFHSAAPYMLHRFGRNPYIFDYDDYDVELSNFFSRGKWNRLFFGTNRWDTITEQMASRALCCVAASHELIDYLKEFNSKVYYIPTGVDCEAFEPKDYREPSEPADATVVFFWNGLVWGTPVLKSLRLLLEAMRGVYREHSNILLRVIGGGDCFEQFRNIAAREFSEVPLEIMGWMEPGQMPAELRRVDVGCLPFDAACMNRWLKSKSPTKMFEYMAVGLPVVASAVGEATHVIEDGRSGFLVSSRDEMIQRMLELARSVSLRREMGLAARQRISENYSLPILGARLREILSELGWAEPQ